MRESLRISLDDRPDGKTRHAIGDIVICNGCALPLFVLERGIDAGDRASAAADAFAPIRLRDIQAMASSPHIDAGVRAWARSLTSDAAIAHVDGIARPRAGDPMVCPFCAQAWVQVLTAEESDTLDRAYVLELVTVRLTAPGPQVRGFEIGAAKGWIH